MSNLVANAEVPLHFMLMTQTCPFFVQVESTIFLELSIIQRTDLVKFFLITWQLCVLLLVGMEFVTQNISV